MPYVLGQSTVVVPISELHWIIDQPNTVLSAQENSRIGLQSDWTLLDPKVVTNQVVPRVVRHRLVRTVANFIEPMVDEFRVSFDEYWGTGEQNWREIRAFVSMKDIIARVSNRVFAGIPLCTWTCLKVPLTSIAHFLVRSEHRLYQECCPILGRYQHQRAHFTSLSGVSQTCSCLACHHA